MCARACEQRNLVTSLRFEPNSFLLEFDVRQIKWKTNSIKVDMHYLNGIKQRIIMFNFLLMHQEHKMDRHKIDNGK